MARQRASMREGPLAELFRATEAAQRQAERSLSRQHARRERRPPAEPDERTVDHVPSWEEARARTETPAPPAPSPRPDPMPQPPAAASAAPTPGRRRSGAAQIPRSRSCRRAAAGDALYRAAARAAGAAPSRAARRLGAYLAVIKVVGVGGAGLNAVNRMIDAGHQPGRVHRGQHRHPGART